MSGDLYQIETRRRSRSKTPFLRSSCDHENCEHAGEEGHVHHKKKTLVEPKVRTIIEESIEVSSSSSFTKAGNKLNEDKLPTVDLTGEDSAKSDAQIAKLIAAQTLAATTTTVGSTRSSSTTVFSSRGKAGDQKQYSPNRSSERIAQSEQVQRMAQRVDQRGALTQERRSRRINGYGDGDSNENREYSNVNDHIAYQEYKRAGDYWNKTPKTDYTYSELSPHRRELAPGIVAMPNMSRRSLGNYNERINFLVAQYPKEEAYIRRRYDVKLTRQYDSGDEVDTTQFSTARYTHKEQSLWLRFISIVVTTLSSFWSAIAGGKQQQQQQFDQNDAYYRRTIYGRQQQSVGLFGSIYQGIANGFWGLCRYVYMFISSVLFLDTKLLRSSHAQNGNKKRFLLLLLLLLPLLILAGWCLSDEKRRLGYAQQMQTLLPISMLTGVRSGFHTVGASLRGLLQLPSLTWSANVAVPESEVVQQHLYNIQQNIQKSLTPEEYENILNHVNSYVQTQIDLKLLEQRRLKSPQEHLLTPQQTQLIVALMRENLVGVLQEEQRRRDATVASQTVELSEAEVQRIATLVQLTLKQANDWPTKPVPLTAAQLAEIRKLIMQEIEVHNNAYYTLLVEHIDLDALLTRILATSQLAEFVDAHISAALAERHAKLAEGSGSQQTSAALLEQERLIDQLHTEMAFVKIALSERQSENADLQQSISQLKVTQEDLLERIQQHDFATDKRFSGLLAEIEAKLASLNNTQFAQLNKQVRLTLVDILGFKQSLGTNNNKLDDVDLQNWVRSMFVAKEYLEQRLLELNRRTNNNIRDEIERSSTLLMHDISERLKREIILAVETKHNQSADVLQTSTRSSLSEREVRDIVRSVLAIYDADKTGLVDFALESAGGQILSTRCTESYQTKSAQISVFGIPLWYPTNTPRIAISPNVQPGECWAFQGFPGFLVLKLNTLVYVSGFTLEHIPKSLSPTGRIDSAPRVFTVWGLAHEKDQDPVQFGEYEYVDNDSSLQYFPTQNLDIERPYQIVELRIESNHGESTYTCLYRFRVHGKPPAT